MTAAIQQLPAGQDTASPYEGLAAGYNRARPGYPDEAIADLRSSAGDIVVDVGAGTGIFTRQLAAAMRNARVVGVEPSADMRHEAEAASIGVPGLVFAAGTAEALPFQTASVSILTAATAVHWFNRPVFYAEAFRCLRRGGLLVILQNVRRWWDSDFLAAYEELHESTVPGYRRGRFPACDGGYREIDVVDELSGRPDVSDVGGRSIDWSMSVAADDFLELSLSSTITQRAIAGIGCPAYLGCLGSLLALYAPSGSVPLPYVTRIAKATRGPALRASDITSNFD
jgi:SAM-dependent methyltransferase